MTTEVDRYEPAVEPLFDSPLVVWAREAQAAHRIATSLVKTSFVPAAMRGKPEEATAAILTGQEVGLEPMASLRSIQIIQGTPAMSAMAMRALVQSRGHEVWVEEQTDTRAVVCGQRKGSDKVNRSTWTIERARKLGLASKDNWTKQPQAMLIARATSEACRLTAADVLLGLPYSVEELDDQQHTDVTPAPTRRTAKRKPVEPVVVPEPDLEPVETPEEIAAEAATDQGDEWDDVELPEPDPS